jgi:hypothetical protein
MVYPIHFSCFRNLSILILRGFTMQKMLKLFWAVLAVFICFTPGTYSQTEESEAAVPSELIWPRDIETPEAKIIIYQPQLEDLSENRLHARFAASVQKTGAEEPVFGAVWMNALIDTDRDERTVRLVSIENVESRFPGATPEQEQWFESVLKQEIPKWDIVLSLDQLITSLEMEQVRIKTEQELNNKPPKIIYVKKPAFLVLVDGEPILKPIENSDLMTVINTPFPMVFRKADKNYYLIGKETWYRSKKIPGQWEETSDPPADVAVMEREASEDEENESSVAAGIAVFGATEPTELLSINGDPELVPFPGNNLMYVKNTDNNLLYEVDKGSYYLLLSGRWYMSKKLDGSWAYVQPEKLPKDFNDIPADSEKGELRASVPGTEEARDAVLDSQIPETAAVKRSEAKLTVKYDGEPKFEPINGIEIDYAVNTATPVIRVKGKYYAVDSGIWFTSSSAKGPWIVADSVPAEVQDIPPSSPVNNIKYVYVYDSTPEVVYVGYTPGYTGCYIYRGVVVYGTGYYYHPWYGHYYYPRPCTYGFSVSYSSYYGWSFGFSFYQGPFSFHFGHAWGPPRYGGWWGPPMYRPPYYRPPYYRPPPPPVYRPPGNRPPVARPPQGGKPGQLPAGQIPGNRPNRGDLYNQRPDKSVIDRSRPATLDRRDKAQAGKPAALPNNVYTDRQGNVYRKGDNGWEQRQNNQWQRPAEQSQKLVQQPARPAQRPSQTPQVLPSGTQQRDSYNNRSLDSLQRVRSRGNQRTRNYYRGRQMGSGSRSLQGGRGVRSRGRR